MPSEDKEKSLRCVHEKVQVMRWIEKDVMVERNDIPASGCAEMGLLFPLHLYLRGLGEES